MQKPIELKFLARFNLEDLKPVLVVANPADCDDFNWIIGKRVRIDGAEYTVKSVRPRSALELPWKKGEPIGLLTTP